MAPVTMAGDREVGNVALYYEATGSVESYAVENNALKIFYNDSKNYLLYNFFEK
jgi:hypothetical protein